MKNFLYQINHLKNLTNSFNFQNENCQNVTPFQFNFERRYSIDYSIFEFISYNQFLFHFFFNFFN